jgi:hypothetical protein
MTTVITPATKPMIIMGTLMGRVDGGGDIVNYESSGFTSM